MRNGRRQTGGLADDAITQAAAAWVLSCVFVRFLEDNQLIEPPKIAGRTSVVSGRGPLLSDR